MAKTLYDRLNEIKTKHLSPQSVTGDKIASNSIEDKHLKDGSVTRDKIADKIVGTDEIIDGAVTKPKIAKNAVSSDAIIGGSVTTEKIADSAVNASKIASNAITTEKIANGAITRDKVADRSVGTDDLVDGSVTTAKLATSAVTKIKLASNSVGYLEIINGSVEPRHIRAVDSPVNGEVPSYNQLQERFEWIAPGGGGVSRPLLPPVATGEIAIGAVDGERLAVSAVTKAKLSYKVISITIPALQVGGLYPPLGDPDLNGGVILGYSIPTNQDQLIRQLFLLPGLPQGTGISILLNQPAIVDNTFEVVVLRG